MLYEASKQQARQAAPVGSATVAQGAKSYDAWRTTADKEHAVFSLNRQKQLCYLGLRFINNCRVARPKVLLGLYMRYLIRLDGDAQSARVRYGACRVALKQTP